MIEPQTPEPPRSLRIFVVENHADTLKWLSRYLETVGHTVVGVKTVAEALEGLKRDRYDVLISDIGLPDGNGWELLQNARPLQPVYAIAMSGFGMTADHAKSKAAGYRHHFLKPFVADELDVALAQAAQEISAREAKRDEVAVSHGLNMD